MSSIASKSSDQMPVIQCQRLAKSYHDHVIHVDVLHQLNLTVYAGELISIMGPSGSGKSTLLHLLGGLDSPTDGEIWWSGILINNLKPTALSQLRNRHVGFVYQFHHLLPELCVWENVALPLLIAGSTMHAARAQAEWFLAEVGLSHRLSHKIAELSGGERQRTAIARALVVRPSCVLADEPTGNLDAATAAQIIELILQLQENYRMSFVIVTHDVALASQTHKILRIEQGRLVV